MNTLELKLCDMQGRLFELSLDRGYDSAAFIEAFMRSSAASHLDQRYNRLQWAGEAYLLAELADEAALKTGGEQYARETMYWSGYLYRAWHFLTGESSRAIYAQAPANTMRQGYLMLHTMSVQLAVEHLKEMHRQKTKGK